MLPAVVVFFIVAGVVLAGFAAITFLPEKLANRRMDRRLRDVTHEGTGLAAAPDGSVVKQEIEGPIPAIDRMLSRTSTGSRLERLIERSGTRTTPGGVLIMSLASAAAGAGVAVLAVKYPIARPIAAVFGFFVPVLVLKRKATLRLRRFEEAFPEALDLLSRAIRAGHAFQTALGMVASELPPPIGSEFKKTFDQQNYGLPLRDALNEMAERVPLLDVKFFTTAVLIQRDTGGNLAEILDNLAAVVRERFKILRQVRVHTAHGRFTGYVLLALPAALGIALSFINPDHMQLLFQERTGQTLVMAAIVMQTIGFFWIRYIIKIEV
jgi:tight adherence protein B